MDVLVALGDAPTVVIAVLAIALGVFLLARGRRGERPDEAAADGATAPTPLAVPVATAAREAAAPPVEPEPQPAAGEPEPQPAAVEPEPQPPAVESEAPPVAPEPATPPVEPELQPPPLEPEAPAAPGEPSPSLDEPPSRVLPFRGEPLRLRKSDGGDRP
ncbi:MAG TPA: hypothetical protein VG474_15960 [Solirubrobacteraceae bacterium]|nr:hypothetical protein [Solirubrobacteraceae bacterium]